MFDQLNAFRESARVYETEKKKLKTLKGSNDPFDLQLAKYIKSEVDFVESTLDRIAEQYGPNARTFAWEMFVEGKSQEALAKEYGLTRRQMQYQVSKWFGNN